MSERVLITGASGFVGYHLIESALKNNLEVFAAVRNSSKIEHLRHFDIQYVYPDFNNVDSLVAELEKGQYHYIIHASGTTKAETAQYYNLINANYTFNLGVAAVKAKIPLKKFVFFSSLAAVGPLTDLNSVITERTLTLPVTAYGRSKLLAEQKLTTLMSLPLITLRPTAVYGPFERDLLIIFKKISEGVEPYIGKIEQKLSFIYVTDLADICIRALFSRLQHQTYNLSDGMIYNRYDMGTYAKAALNRNTFRIHIPMFVIQTLALILELVYKFSDKVPALNFEKLNELTATNWGCSIEKAEADLGFKPRYLLKDGIAETLKWYKQQHWI